MGIFRRALRGVGRLARRIFSGRRKPAKAVRRVRRNRVKSYNKVLSVKKTVLYERQVVPCNTTVFRSDTFELADIPQYTPYVQLYDKYKINKVVITYKTLTNASTIYQAPGQVTTTGIVHSIIDNTDVVAPTAIQPMMNDSTYKCTNGTKNHTRVIYPKFMSQIGGGVQGKSNSGWLNTKLVDDTTVSAVSHYGIKFAFEGGTATSSAYTSMIFECIYTYYISFKDPK